MKDVWLEDPLGERKLLPSELPLSVGGPGAAVVIPGCKPGEVRARIALTTQGLAVTPEAGAGPDALDGVRIALEDRDGRAVIVVSHGGVANIDAPAAVREPRGRRRRRGPHPGRNPRLRAARRRGPPCARQRSGAS